MTGPPRVSVILPALDEGRVIGSLLEALQPCREQGHELILADGGSRDGTMAIAAPLVDRLVRSAPGRARQMNAGARAANGDFLWFLHADSTVSPAAVGALADALGRGRRCWGRFDVTLSGGRRALRVVEFMMNWRSRFSGIATGDQAIFITRAAFEAVGGYPEIPLMEDVAISRSLKRLSRPVTLRTRIVTSSRRWEQQGVLRTVLLMWRLRLAFALGADPVRLSERYRQCSSPGAGS